jgi:hypothetical protein
MKMLKRLFSLFRPRREDPKPTSFAVPLLDPDEFARLISSGRAEDLRILAKKLSVQPKAHA